jgi:hypothetical protein
LALPAAVVAKDAEYTFGTLRSATSESAKATATAWLESIGKLDPTAIDAIWAQSDVTVLDKVAEALKLGSADAKKVIDESAVADRHAPKAVPAFLKDPRQDAFFRANLVLVYARNLSNARVHEEALEALESIKAEQVVDPAAYLFHRAVAEYSLMKKAQAQKTLTRLLEFAADAPDRYRILAAIMLIDLQSWMSDRDLKAIARLMDNSERRLDLGRGGKITQDIQKRIVYRLDELIKEKEKPPGDGPGTPRNRPGGDPIPNAPMPEPNIAPGGGPGDVLERKLADYQKRWITMPDHERARAMQELTRDLPARYRAMIEEYFKAIDRMPR